MTGLIHWTLADALRIVQAISHGNNALLQPWCFSRAPR